MSRSKLLACCGVALLSCAPSRLRPLDPKLFVRRAEFTPERYRLAPVVVPGRLTRADLVTDIAYLETMLDAAWAVQTPASRLGLTAELHELARRARSPADFCTWLAVTLRNTTLHVTADGHACQEPQQGATDAVEHLALTESAVEFRRVSDPAGVEVGLLTVRRFDAADPAWAEALRAVAGAERVIVDVQEAAGDAPDLALGVLAALGIEAYGHWSVPPPERHDGAYADVARNNARARAPATASSDRAAAWSSITSADAARALGRSTLGTVRTAALDGAWFITGTGCGTSCSFMLALAQASPMPGVTIAGPRGSADEPGDQRGLIRLPRSGIEVTFPTAAYAPYEVTAYGGYTYAHRPPLAHVLAELTAIGVESRDAQRWRTAPLPSCASLPESESALAGKTGGYPAAPVGEAGSTVSVQLGLDADRAVAFLETCPELVVGSYFQLAPRHVTLVYVSAPRRVLRRLASAPFVRSVEWDCNCSRIN